MKRSPPFTSLAIAAATALIAATAHAEGWTGGLSLTSDRVENGVSQSAGSSSLGADLEWSHAAGFHAGLGAASVDPDEFGGARVRWSPRIGWRFEWPAGTQPLVMTVSVQGQLYPGADRPRSATLPTRLAASAQAWGDRYDSADAAVSVRRAGWSLSLSRSLSDYQGLSADRTTGVAGQRVTEKSQGSAGSLHAELGYRHEFDGGTAGWIVAERQRVANFPEFSSSGWRLGVSHPAWGLDWALELHGSSADADYWRVQRADGQSRSLTSRGGTLTVSWAFP